MATSRFICTDHSGHFKYGVAATAWSSIPNFIAHINADRYLLQLANRRLGVAQVNHAGARELTPIFGVQLGATSAGVAVNERFYFIMGIASFGIRLDWVMHNETGKTIDNIQIRTTTRGNIFNEHSAYYNKQSGTLTHGKRYPPSAREIRNITGIATNMNGLTSDERYIYGVKGTHQIFKYNQDGKLVKTISVPGGGSWQFKGIAYNGKDFICLNVA